MWCNKGEIVRLILGRIEGRPSFILAAGDDRTDEDMFRVVEEYFQYEFSQTSKDLNIEANIREYSESGKQVLLENGLREHYKSIYYWTCRIGAAERQSNAQFHLPTPEDFVNLLHSLSQ